MGNQYIDTGVKLDFSNENYTKVNVKCCIYSILQKNASSIFGSRVSVTSNRCDLVLKSGSVMGINDSYYVVNNIVENNVLNIIYEKSKITVNGVSQNLTPATQNLQYNLYLGGTNTAGEFSNSFVGKIYYMKIYQNDSLIRDFIPVIKNDGVVCFYDLVTKEYFYNKGTGKFNYSDNVIYPEGTQKVEYMECNGLQYIDTGIKPDFSGTNYSIIEVGCMVYSKNINGQSLFGSRVSATSNRYDLILQSSPIMGINNSYNTITSSIIEENKIINIRCTNSNILINDNTATLTKATQKMQNNIYLGGTNTAGNFSNPFKGRIYYMKIYQNGEIVKYFVPLIDSNNRNCFYDIINSEYYYSLGTEDFIAPNK